MTWLSSKRVRLRFEYYLPELITDGYVAKLFRENEENWLINALSDQSSDEIYDQILQFRSVDSNHFEIEYLTLGTKARIKSSAKFEMNDLRNTDFYNALRENEIVTIECNIILEIDDISVTIEIIPEQKVLRLIRIDQCIRHNQLNELKGHV